MDKLEKFNEHDRELVINEIQKIQGVVLSQIKPTRKLFESNKGLVYLISGGTGLWHGINKQVVEAICSESNTSKENVFIVAKKYRTQIDIYVGSLLLFISNIENLRPTKTGGLQFHCIEIEDGLYLDEIPELVCNKVHTIYLSNHKRNVELYRQNAKLLNIEIPINSELSHTDIQAKLLLIGSYLNYRTYTPDISKYSSVFKSTLGNISSEKEFPKDSIPQISIGTIKMIDVIWFDEEGFPTHAFEVEHTTDITKGLLRLYQTRKLKIKMFIISNQHNKFETEVSKSPFVSIKDEFIFKNYDELEEFFESVKQFKQMKEKFKV